MIPNIGFITSQPSNEKTGRVGGNARYTADQNTLKETQIMIPKSVTNGNLLGIKLNLD